MNVSRLIWLALITPYGLLADEPVDEIPTAEFLAFLGDAEVQDEEWIDPLTLLELTTSPELSEESK